MEIELLSEVANEAPQPPMMDTILHQKEHFVNYFLTCYVLPGNDLRPVG